MSPAPDTRPQGIEGIRTKAGLREFIRQQPTTPGGEVAGRRLNGPLKIATLDTAPAADPAGPLHYAIDNAGTIEFRVVFPNGNDKLIEDDS